MEIDPVLLTEVLERLSAAIDAGIPIRRFKWAGLEIELGEVSAESSTPLAPTPRNREESEPVSPYERLFRGQKPSFRSE